MTPQAADEALGIGEIADGAAKVDKMGQPLNGRSNYNAWKQFGKIMSEASSDSLSTTAGKIWDWGTYTVPDADQRIAEYMGRDARWSQIDQMRESPLGAIDWGASRFAGGSPEAQQMWLDIGTSADGLAMSAAALSARSPAFTGARGMPELASEPKLFEAYDRTRVGVEREMFRTPKDELSIIISRDSGSEMARQLVPGNGGSLNPNMLQNMQDNTFTHFHPTGGNFSTSDVMTGLDAGLFFDPDEIQAAYLLNKLRPPTTPTLNEVVRMIARAGGFLARKGDGEPGAKTIWEGICDVRASAHTIKTLREMGMLASCV